MTADIQAIRDIYPFESHYFELKGCRYHYVDEGSGEVFLMVHGNPTWSFMFREMILEFRKTHRVIAPDHLGCGLSDKPPAFPYRLETHIDNLEALVLGLKLNDINLLVHDWGGPIGLGFALRYPERIKRIIISNSAAFAMNRIPWRISIGRIPYVGRKLIVDMNLFARFATLMTTVRPLSEQVRAGYLLPFAGGPQDRTAILRFVEDIPMGPDHPSFELLLGIEHGLWMFREKPVAVVWGMKDWCFTPLFFERWVDFFPHAETLTLDNAAHLLYEDAVQDLVPFFHHFLAE